MSVGRCRPDAVDTVGVEQAEAVRSRVLRLPQVLTDDEVLSLDKMYAAIRAEEQASHDAAVTADAAAEGAADGGDRAQTRQLFQHPNLTGRRDSAHITGYLHCGGRMARDLPELLAKTMSVMREADADSWGLLQGVDDQVRVLEYHEYTRGGAVANPKHCDSGSLVTMSVLLSDAADFTGGCFTTLELDGSVTKFSDVKRGDGLVFVSEKWHSVQPVLSGVRRSFVTELWAYTSWPWGRRGPTVDAATGAIAMRRVDTPRAELIELYTSAADVSEQDIDEILGQYVGCERELLVELKAAPGAIHELLLPESGGSSSDDSSDESISGE